MDVPNAHLDAIMVCDGGPRDPSWRERGHADSAGLGTPRLRDQSKRASRSNIFTPRGEDVKLGVHAGERDEKVLEVAVGLLKKHGRAVEGELVEEVAFAVALAGVKMK